MRRLILELGLLGLLTLGATACTVTVAGQGPPPEVGHDGPRVIHVPPGHQPPPGPCHHLSAGHGAFVLYNSRAWDADYDWRSYARRHPGTVPKVIIKIKSR